MTNSKHWPAAQSEMRNLADLIPYARNARTHSDEQIAQVAASIREWGWTMPVLVDEQNGIIAGHCRVLAARQLKLDEVPVVIAKGWTDAQKRAYVLADNQLAVNAGWDDEFLSSEFAELKAANFDMDLIGFDSDEIDKLLAKPTEGLTDPDETPEPPVDPVTRLGDVWVCGQHRVMCGDSTNINDVEKLMDNFRADICFTSPPYALDKSASLSGNKTISSRGAAYDKHKDDAESWSALMAGWWAASLPFVTAWVVNVQPLANNKRELFKWINDRIERLVDVATWDKGHAAPQMASGVMSSRYEWIMIFGDDGASRVIPFSSWHGTIQSVYSAPPQRKNEFAQVHGATMPSHLAEWSCGVLCDKAKSVFDPFGGTGTTMIACEKLKKTAYLMEISASYCDVIVKRWQDFTGQKAFLEGTNQSFDEVKAA
jgi:DNA modification methylase